jgi:two-component system CheB/CheR fusion protein
VVGWVFGERMSTPGEDHDTAPEAIVDEQGFGDLLEYLRRTRGFDFTAYKPASLMRRIVKRMEAVSTTGFAEYAAFLEAHSEEFGYLFNTILINVTAFFRDAATWDALRDRIVPELLADSSGGAVRIWSAGCASGEEAYSLAIVLAEALGPAEFLQRVKIYATDADDEALDDARRAAYPDRQIEAVPPSLRLKYFSRIGDRYVFNQDLRRAVIFGRHDLIQDSPISRVNLLTCRNTLMYFNTEAQSQILRRFHFSLVNSGILVLGKAEMLLTRSELFAPIEPPLRVFRKLPRPYQVRSWGSAVSRRQGKGDTPRAGDATLHDTQGGTELMDTQALLYSAAFDATPTAQIVVDVGGVLALFNDRACNLFNLLASDIGRQFHELELSYSPVELRSLIQRAQEQRRPSTVKDVQIERAGREPSLIDVQVTPLFDAAGKVLGTTVTFTDTSRVQQLQQQLARSKQDLETTYEELQSTNEELETTNEELQSTVEELETTNEELQSTNEELETMNEELQSTNEELHGINKELRVRSEEFSLTNMFLESVLRGMRGAVLVVDRELHITAWNRRSEELWGLRSEEVIGRSAFGLDIGFPIEQLRGVIRSTMAGENNVTETSVAAVNRRGRPIQCKVTTTALAGEGRDPLGVILMVEEEPAAP